MYTVKSVTATKRIRVSIETRQALQDIGKKGESFDAVIRRLIKYWVLEESYEGAASILDLFDMEEEVKE